MCINSGFNWFKMVSQPNQVGIYLFTWLANSKMPEWFTNKSWLKNHWRIKLHSSHCNGLINKNKQFLESFIQESDYTGRPVFVWFTKISQFIRNIRSPSWELELRPLGVATGNASSVTRVWRYICKNTTCWPATAHDVTTGVSQYKCRREHTSSAFSSSLTGLFEETCILVGIQFSFIYHGEH